MPGRSALTFCSVCTLALATATFAAPARVPIRISSGPLAYGLQTLQRQTGIDLLFDRTLVSDVESPAVDGELTAEGALRQLLTGTSLELRQARSGAWIIQKASAAPLSQPDAPVPEVLVVGQRTQNADIRRFENDIQPYTIITRAKLLNAHRDNVDQYFTGFITANTQVVPTSLDGTANPLSEINLRGLGARDTLVLIDGRRLPGVPTGPTAFGQTDVNAIPLHAIERIEVLTGTAGGIHGFGALGGVVNVVLDRKHRGFDVHLTGGVSSRGDASRESVEASYGHTSQDGRTDMTIFASHSRKNPLLVGERGYAIRDRERNARAFDQPLLGEHPYGNSVTVRNLFGSELVFKPAYGGGTLGSSYTFLPAGFSGDAPALVAALRQNAGQVDRSLAEGDARVFLDTSPRSQAWLANIRHRFGNGLEAYADALVLRSRGRFFDGHSTGQAMIGAISPANPFTEYVSVEFPLSGLGSSATRRVENARYTAGLQTDLPFHWRGTLEATAASIHHATSVHVLRPAVSYLTLLGLPSDSTVNPFGDWNTLQRALTTQTESYAIDYRSVNRLRDGALRLAGPLFSTDQGPTTLSVVAEHRSERVPTSELLERRESGGVTTPTTTSLFSYSSKTSSAYAELKSQPYRVLELQLAARRDEQEIDFPGNPIGEDENGRIRMTFAGTSYTAGAKISPWPWLALRASYATGDQPPEIAALLAFDDEMTTLPWAADPRRGDSFLGADNPYLLRRGGHTDLRTARARTLSMGALLSPFGEQGARFSIDFSRIRRTRDVLMLQPDFVLAHEDFWPERVTRAPLSDADRELGYTGGPVTALDSRDMNGEGVEVETFDARFTWPLPFAGGRLQLYADATYHMNNWDQSLFQPDTQTAGYWNGPLKWRANGGAEWSTERLTVGANVQHFGSYLVFEPETTPAGEELRAMIQGSRRLPSQTYLDLHATLRLSTRLSSRPDDLTLSLGIVNVLDTAPPHESSLLVAFTGPGYSRYGDPRQRRFELAISQRF